jgi:hypothetical protein
MVEDALGKFTFYVPNPKESGEEPATDEVCRCCCCCCCFSNFILFNSTSNSTSSDEYDCCKYKATKKDSGITVEVSSPKAVLHTKVLEGRERVSPFVE